MKMDPDPAPHTAPSGFLTPLRYPGGKGKVARFIRSVFEENNLLDGIYAEPYAGGAAVALELLFNEYVRGIYINDFSPQVAAFWRATLDDTDNLVRKIRSTKVDMDSWRRQREIYLRPQDSDDLTLGFATFFLNRTNRSGILKAGVIGGQRQDGKWKIDARYNSDELISRIEAIARLRDRICFTQLDAVEFLKHLPNVLPPKALVYLDPPYYVKGKDLYTHFYEHDDHALVAQTVPTALRGIHWIVSYDDTPEISSLYSEFRHITYTLSYSAQERYKGSEIMFFSDNLSIPEIMLPMRAVA